MLSTDSGWRYPRRFRLTPWIDRADKSRAWKQGRGWMSVDGHRDVNQRSLSLSIFLPGIFLPNMFLPNTFLPVLPLRVPIRVTCLWPHSAHWKPLFRYHISQIPPVPAATDEARCYSQIYWKPNPVSPAASS